MGGKVRRSVCLGVIGAVALAGRSASADDASEGLAPAPTRAPYSIPWQLRPLPALTGVRLDTSLGRYEDERAVKGRAVTSLLSAQYKIPGTGPSSSGLAVLVRAALSNNSPPTGPGATIVSNPVIGVSYALSHSSGFRGSVSLSGAIPVGSGGGNNADLGSIDARGKATATRLSLDNSFFAANDASVVGGIGAGYVAGGATVQIEATLFQAFRVRGERLQHEASKTNFTSGIHLGYFFASVFSLGGEVRYQRWLNGPFAAEAVPNALDQASFAVGPRLHFQLGHFAWFRPGVAYARGIDRPLAGATPNYHIVQLDLPFLLL